LYLKVIPPTAMRCGFMFPTIQASFNRSTINRLWKSRLGRPSAKAALTAFITWGGEFPFAQSGRSSPTSVVSSEKPSLL